MKIKNKSIHKKCLLSSFLPPFSQPQRQLYQTGCGHSPSAVAGHTAGRHGAFFLSNFNINEMNTSQIVFKKEKVFIKRYLHICIYTHTHTLQTHTHTTDIAKCMIYLLIQVNTHTHTHTYTHTHTHYT